MGSKREERWVEAVGRIAKIVAGDKLSSVTVEVPETKMAYRIDLLTESGFRARDLIRIWGMSTGSIDPVIYYHEPMDGTGKANWRFVNIERASGAQLQWPSGFGEAMGKAAIGGREDPPHGWSSIHNDFVFTRDDMKASVAYLRQALAAAEKEEWLREEPKTVRSPDLSDLSGPSKQE